MAYPIASLPDGRVRYSDGTVRGGSSSAPQMTPLSGYGTQSNGWNYAQTSPIGGNWINQPMTPRLSPGVLGMTDQTSGGGAGGGGGGGGGDNNGQNFGVDQAYARRLADWETAKERSRGMVDSGKRGFDTLMSGVNDFRDRTGQLYNDAEQQITNRFGELTGQNARLGQSARTQAIQQARRGGYGDSSRLGLLNQVTGNLAGMQGAASAMRGENQAQNSAIQDERMGQASQSELAGKGRLADIEQEAGRVYGADINNANLNFGDMINNIVNYERQLAAINAPSAQGLTAYNPNFEGLTNTLNSMNNPGMASNQGGNMAANLANPTTIQELLRKRGLV